MKNKIQSILWLAAVILGFTNGAATVAQSVSPARQEKTADQSTVNRSAADQDASERAAIEILEKHVEALGGRDAFAKVKSVETQTELALLGRTTKVRRINDVAGNRSVSRQDNGGNISETGYDGKRAWQKAPHFRGYLEASSPQAKSFARGGVRLPGASLYDYKTEGKKFVRLADEQIGATNYLVVKSGYADETNKEPQIKYYFDPKTYLLKQLVSGNAITQTETFDDYRKVGGITVAFATTTTNPQFSAASKIIELKFNVPIDPTVFEFQEASVSPTSNAKTADESSKNELPKNELPKNESPKSIETTGGLSESIRLETFERVWKTVDDTFYDRSFNGINWQAMRDKYLPLAKTTADNDDFHKLLDRMVQELQLSHFKVIPPKNVRTPSSNAASLNIGTIGFGVQWIDNQLLVSEVAKNFPAEAAGIRPGFILNRINGRTPDELYAQYQKDNPGYRLREELARVRAVAAELAGKADTKINLELTGEREESLKLELTRKSSPMRRQLEFESKKLAGNVGYIKFNLFFGDLLPKFQTALRELSDTKTLIIDLRGNPGGAGDLAPAMANLLSEKPGSLGSLKLRYETQQYSFTGTGEQAYRGKVIILIDAGSGSTSEVFAGGMQANKRAVVIGSASAGAVMPSLMAMLPTGGLLQHVVSNFQTPNGIALEGKGVVPDVTAKTSRSALLAGRDTMLETALSYAGKQ